MGVEESLILNLRQNNLKRNIAEVLAVRTVVKEAVKYTVYFFGGAVFLSGAIFTASLFSDTKKALLKKDNV